MPAESQFAIKVVVTWLLLFVGYGVYVNASLGEASGNFEPLDEDTDELNSMGGIASMDGMSSVESSTGDFDSDEGGVENVEGHPAFSPEGLLHWFMEDAHDASYSQLPIKIQQGSQSTNSANHCCRRSPTCTTRTMKNMRMPAVCCIWWMIYLEMKILQMAPMAHQVNS